MKQPLFIILIAGLFTVLAFSGWKSWQMAEAYESETLLIINQLTASSQLEKSGLQLLEVLSFGLYDEYSRNLEMLNQHKVMQNAYAESVEVMVFFFGVAALLVLILTWFFRRDMRDLAYGMLGIALIALVVGLSSPILSIEASQNLPVLGDTVLQYQSKGILSTLLTLHGNGYWWLALVLLLFSVVIPVSKTFIGGLTLFDRASPLIEKWFHLSHHLGKWSMADVFVVAILVAFFANSGDQGLTHAEVRPGLWFFLAYVLLSLLAFQILQRRFKRIGA